MFVHARSRLAWIWLNRHRYEELHSLNSIYFFSKKYLFSSCIVRQIVFPRTARAANIIEARDIIRDRSTRSGNNDRPTRNQRKLITQMVFFRECARRVIGCIFGRKRFLGVRNMPCYFHLQWHDIAVVFASFPRHIKFYSAGYTKEDA